MGDDPLLAACSNGCTAIVQELLALNGPGRLDLILASACSVIAKLIHGDRKEWVTRHSQWKVLPHDDASSTGLSALFQLCWGLSTLGPYGPLLNGGHAGVVRQLLALGGDRRVDVHSGHDSAFVQASSRGHIEVVQILLDLSSSRTATTPSSLQAAFVGRAGGT